jgi:hypothetical protein
MPHLGPSLRIALEAVVLGELRAQWLLTQRIYHSATPSPHTARSRQPSRTGR